MEAAPRPRTSPDGGGEAVRVGVINSAPAEVTHRSVPMAVAAAGGPANGHNWTQMVAGSRTVRSGPTSRTARSSRQMGPLQAASNACRRQLWPLLRGRLTPPLPTVPNHTGDEVGCSALAEVTRGYRCEITSTAGLLRARGGYPPGHPWLPTILRFAPHLRRSPAANDRKRPGGRGCSAPVEVTHRRWPDWSRRRRLLRMRGGHPFTATRVLHHMDSAPHPWRSPVAEPVRGSLLTSAPHPRRSPGRERFQPGERCVCSAPAEVTRRREGRCPR